MKLATLPRTQADITAVITPAMRQCVNTVLLAQVHYQVQKERMDALDAELLSVGDWPIDPKWSERCRSFSHQTHVRTGNDLHLLREDLWDPYYAERQRRVDAMGYTLPRGQCPACVAETLLSQAEHCLIEAFEPLTGIQCEHLLSRFEHYKPYVDLLLKLVINLPDFVPPAIPKP